MHNKQQVIDFIKWIKGTGQVQICTLNTPISFADAEGKENIYFCWGLKTKMTKRCDDSDIGAKRYVAIDIDIRNDYFLKTGEVISQEKLREIIEQIRVKIDESDHGGYCAIIDSWNWVHFYWTWEEKIYETEEYANGVKQMQLFINSSLWELGFLCDPACVNLSRIMRLPWTLNPRKKNTKNIQYDLWPVEAEILFFEERNSEVFDALWLYALLYKEQHEKEKEEKKTIKQEIKKVYTKWDDIWKEINSIPVQNLAEYVWGVRVGQDDGEIITLKEEKKNMGAYVYKPYNIVYNQWSSLVKTDRTTFTPFEIICFEVMGWDQKATIEWFKDKYGIAEKPKGEIVIQKKEYSKQWFLFPDDIFDEPFDCVMSWELVTIVAESNTGKTTFAMDMIARNVERGKKCLYINLEFGIEQVATNNWLFMNGKKKRNLTDIEPLSHEDQMKLKEYTKWYLSRFENISSPWGIEPEELYQLLIEKANVWYDFIVIDTFSMINGNSDEKAWVNQNKCMKALQEIAQNTWLCILQLHHTNKSGQMEGSKKILNLSNTLITLSMKYDDIMGTSYTEATLSKDKFTTRKMIEFHWKDRKRHLFNS